MKTIDDGGTAFPVPNFIRTYGPGMTQRTYFAAKAIPVAAEWEESSPTHFTGDPFPSFKGVAQRAYLLADAMLIARGESNVRE